MLTIDVEIARRFILGRQGLWPGRRWHGLKGVDQAMRAIEYLQLDPLQIIARSQDIALHSRVLDYEPGMWETVTYEQRKFGYYALPILWGERLVARFDSKLDRTTNTFMILGLWLEDEALGKNEEFAEALAVGFARFVTFLGAGRMNAQAIREPLLRRRATSLIRSHREEA
ncbi:MAG: hypothetical protein AB1846_18360 [Chloroflexota bacterium]